MMLEVCCSHSRGQHNLKLNITRGQPRVILHCYQACIQLVDTGIECPHSFATIKYSNNLTRFIVSSIIIINDKISITLIDLYEWPLSIFSYYTSYWSIDRADLRFGDYTGNISVLSSIEKYKWFLSMCVCERNVFRAYGLITRNS